MSLSKFSKQGTAAPQGGRFSGGGGQQRQAPPQQQRPAQGGGRFGGQRAPEPEPQDDPNNGGGYDEEPEQQAPQRGGGGGGGGGGGRFGRSGNSAPQRGGRAPGQGRDRAPHVAQRGRFTGLRSKKPKPPWLEDGKHLVEVVQTFESFKPGTGPRTHIQVKILRSNNPTHEEGEIRSVKYNTDERAWGSTAEAIFMFARAAAGFASDEEALDTLGEEFMQDLIDAMNGNPEAQKIVGPNGAPVGDNPLAGSFLEVIGSKGNMADNGTQFYEFDWFPAQAPF